MPISPDTQIDPPTHRNRTWLSPSPSADSLRASLMALSPRLGAVMAPPRQRPFACWG